MKVRILVIAACAVLAVGGCAHSGSRAQKELTPTTSRAASRGPVELLSASGPVTARVRILRVGIHPSSGIGLLSQVLAEVLEVREGDLTPGRQITFAMGTEEVRNCLVGQEYVLTHGHGVSVHDQMVRIKEVKPAAGNDREEFLFGQARIAVGMTKEQVLEQIRLSTSQYDPLQDERSTDLYVGHPSDDTIRSDTWYLTCPTRNSHVLGGGSGMMLGVQFRDGKVVRLTRGPWVAG